jgi:hypothetical protein
MLSAKPECDYLSVKHLSNRYDNDYELHQHHYGTAR